MECELSSAVVGGLHTLQLARGVVVPAMATCREEHGTGKIGTAETVFLNRDSDENTFRPSPISRKCQRSQNREEVRHPPEDQKLYGSSAVTGFFARLGVRDRN